MASRFLSKSFHPLKLSLLDSCSKSPFQSLFENALGKTRQLLRVFLGKENKLSSDIGRCQHRLPVEYFQKEAVAPFKSKFVYRPGSIANLTSKWASDSIAGAVSKGWRKKVAQRGGLPMLGFVGFVLAKKPSLLSEEEEHEGVSFLIRDAFSTITWQHIGVNIDKSFRPNTQFSLSDLKLGDMIAKGCNAAVYSAHLQNQSADTYKPGSLVEDPISMPISEIEKKTVDRRDLIQAEKIDETLLPSTKVFISHSEGEINVTQSDTEKPLDHDLHFPPGQFSTDNLAIKIMFNYSAESNSYAIWNAMHKEVLPALSDISLDEEELHKVRKRRLKPHPNIVEMYFAFADMVPYLPGAHKYFPQALPVRLLNDGCGRNMTLFLVMKRYHCSLKEYLKKHKPSPQTSLLLFTQLMEALVHLHQSNIAHRDLKTDNILLDLSEGITFPKLAVTDFGCCLESLSLNYPSYDISKGGNMALMSPEVVTAEAGPFSAIDYSRADLWTAGTLAYEIFGGKNPFYSNRSNLKNSTYIEDYLPPMPADTPVAIQKLVKDMLKRDPRKRPNQTFAATVCQILLHAPSDVLHMSNEKSNKALDWMFLLSSKTYLEGLMTSLSPLKLEFVLRHTFCSRIQYLEVKRALGYILDS